MQWKIAGLAGLLAQSSLVVAQDEGALPLVPVPGWATPSEPLAVPEDVQGPLFLGAFGRTTSSA